MTFKKYRCVFPGCGYETDDRRLIEFHHIKPRELGNTLNRDVTIPLCPTHHKLIYCPESTAGQHSRMDCNSLSVVQVTNTTAGKAVIFCDMNGHEITVTVDNRVPKPSAIYCISWSIVTGISEAEEVDCDSYVESQVDTRGYCQVGNRVFYSPYYCQVAHDLLKAYIVQYMTVVKAEHDAALQKARQDYRRL